MGPRDPQSLPPTAVAFGPWLFEWASGRLSRDGVEVLLPPKPLGVLRCLLERPGEVVPKEILLAHVWEGAFVTDGALSEVVRTLREALGDDSRKPQFIQTIHRRGFRFIAPVIDASDGGLAKTAGVAPSDSHRRMSVGRLPRAGAILLAGAALFYSVQKFIAVSPDRRVQSLSLDFSTGTPLARLSPSLFQPLFDISQDGMRLVYVARDGDETRLFLRPMDSFDARPIAGTERALSPFFSPDGTWVGFFTQQEIRKVSVNGGIPLPICPATGSFGGDWMTDGSIVFASFDGPGLFRVDSNGGKREIWIQPPNSESTKYAWPEALPNGDVLFTIQSGLLSSSFDIAVYSPGAVEPKRLLVGGSQARYDGSGHILFVRGKEIWAVGYDLEGTQTMGFPIPIESGVVVHRMARSAQFAASMNGLLAFGAGGEWPPRSDVVWVNRNGEIETVLETADINEVASSSDGKRFAVQKGDDIWVYDAASRKGSRLTFKGINLNPLWTPDGEGIAFSSSGAEDGRFRIYRQRADGQGVAERLVESDHAVFPTAWFADGRVLLYEEANPQTFWDIWRLDMSRPRTATPVRRTAQGEAHADISRDGRWIAYESDETGRLEVYVEPYPLGEGRWQVSIHGGHIPRWSPNGKELLFWEGSTLKSSRFETTAGFRTQTPHRLFEIEASVLYGIAPDGNRFLMARRREEAGPENIRVVVNWDKRLLRASR